MSLDVWLTFPVLKPGWNPRSEGEEQVFDYNITHNLGKMAKEAGIYNHLWRPEENGITTAQQLIDPLTEGLKFLKSDPDKFKVFNASNGWGLYEHLVEFVEKYLAACIKNPGATVHASR